MEARNVAGFELLEDGLEALCVLGPEPLGEDEWRCRPIGRPIDDARNMSLAAAFHPRPQRVIDGGEIRLPTQHCADGRRVRASPDDSVKHVDVQRTTMEQLEQSVMTRPRFALIDREDSALGAFDAARPVGARDDLRVIDGTSSVGKDWGQTYGSTQLAAFEALGRQQSARPHHADVAVHGSPPTFIDRKGASERHPETVTSGRIAQRGEHHVDVRGEKGGRSQHETEWWSSRMACHGCGVA